MTDELAEIRQKKLEELRNGERGTAAENQSNESAAEPVHVHGAGELQDTVDDGVVLADFYADWCGPCKQLEPVVEGIAAGTAATWRKSTSTRTSS